MKTLVIIPAYNEQDTILNVVKDVTKYNYDYLVINDCSNDNTRYLLEKNNICHISLPINLGIAGVTQVGFKYAYDNNYDCVICIDGDGQHQAKYLNMMNQEIQNGCDYIVGSRFLDEKKKTTIRMIGSMLICASIRIKTGIRVTDPTSGMRALGRKTIEEFSKSMNFYAEPDALCYLLHKKYKVKEIQVEMKERQGGVSYFHNPLKSFYYMIAITLSILLIQ